MVPTLYVSGLSNLTDFAGAAAAGVPIGVQVQEISSRVEASMVSYNSTGGRLFVDSGAFTAFRTGAVIDFNEVLEKYESLARRMEFPGLVAFVAPDVIGDMNATADLQRMYCGRLSRLASLGVEVMIPLQLGWEASAYLSHCLWARENIGAFTLAFACNAQAWSAGDVAAVVKSVSPDRVHLLGAGKKSVFKYAAAVRDVSPATVVSCDANRVRSHIGDGRFITESVRLAVQGAGDEARQEFDHCYDETEIIHDLYNSPGFLSPGESVMLAKALGVTDRRSLAKWARWSQEESDGHGPYGCKLGYALAEISRGYDLDLSLVKIENGAALERIFSSSVVRDARLSARKDAIRDCMVGDQVGIARHFANCSSQLALVF